MPHNHSPRCCCQHVYDGAIITAATPCPSCIEHGELATLNNQCGEQSPSTGAQCTLAQGHAGTHQPTPQAHLEPDEAGLVRFAGVVGYPVEHHSAETMDDWLCHTPAGRPHTDYCQRTRAAQAQTSQPAATTSQPHTQQRPEFIDTCRCQRSLPGQITGYDHHPLCQHHPHQAGGPGPTPIE